jgi:hypothetical protein
MNLKRQLQDKFMIQKQREKKGLLIHLKQGLLLLDNGLEVLETAMAYKYGLMEHAMKVILFDKYIILGQWKDNRAHG